LTILVLSSVSMNTIQLPRNVQFLYEEHLARLEFEALGAHRLTRAGDHWDQMTAVVNGTADLMIARSAYLGALDGRTSVYSELIRPSYQGGRFNRTRSVNQYLTHWIYPYRGKFHPQMVRALMNILGVKPGSLVAEPYLGSGTAALEASLLGANVIGIDLSPLCVMLARVKTKSAGAVAKIRKRVTEILASPKLRLDDDSLADHDESAVADFLQIARMVTFSDVARRSRDGASYLRKNLTAMLASVEAHAAALKEFNIKSGKVNVQVGDCRDLKASGFKANSVDAIVTSPPYSIALDYVKNDEHALDALGVDTTELRDTMTGVRGRGAHQKLALYNDDMQQMFREVAWILKPGARAAFVIGDATVDGREYTTTNQMAEWAIEAGLTLERSIPKIVFGLYGMFVDEKILIFKKD
jgi:SAM-dependent methyltransferase